MAETTDDLKLEFQLMQEWWGILKKYCVPLTDREWDEFAKAIDDLIKRYNGTSVAILAYRIGIDLAEHMELKYRKDWFSNGKAD